MLPECALCGELNPSALMRRAGGFVCANCEAHERRRPEARCARCGLTAPFERHHVEGRRNTPRTAPLCLNCHRIAHAADMRRTLRGAGAAIPRFYRSPNAEGNGPIAGATEVAGGQGAIVRGGHGPALDISAGEAAGGQRAIVRGGHDPTLDMGAGEAAGGLGAMVRGGQGPAQDRSLRTGRRGARVVAAGGERS